MANHRKKIAPEIESWLRRSGPVLAQRDIAAELGVSHSTVCRWLRALGVAPRPRGAKTVGVKFTILEVRAIRAKAEAGMTQVDLATAYGVSRATINYIVNRRSWKHAR